MFKEVTAESGYPHSLVELGTSLPQDGIDTAVRWESVAKTYFFKGNQYWRYNEEKRTVDTGYPRSISVWKGIPEAPQGAFVSREGSEYDLSQCRRSPTPPQSLSFIVLLKAALQSANSYQYPRGLPSPVLTLKGTLLPLEWAWRQGSGFWGWLLVETNQWFLLLHNDLCVVAHRGHYCAARNR